MADTATDHASLVGINHVALEVGDIDAALKFYRSLFEFELRGRTESMVFLDMGDQFIAMAESADAGERPDDHRHFGLVVDDPDLVEERLASVEADRLDTSGLDFRDPWGNRIQIVGYEEIQFSKREAVLESMELADLEKSASARAELAEKGIDIE
ncbi:MAG: VOC family protein [Halobacteriales archaeon]